jgi:peroxiredoxin
VYLTHTCNDEYFSNVSNELANSDIHQHCDTTTIRTYFYIITKMKFLATLTALVATAQTSSALSVLKVNDAVPKVDFLTRTRTETDFDWKVLNSDDYFANKRVVLFALPGAFTPTCSATHLPGYEDSYEKILANGVDEVYCLSVNDAFVMRQWGLHQGIEEDKTPGSLGFTKVKLIPDGAAAFTRGMGMSTVWDKERGFGERSWRYSAVINNGVIEKMFVEGDGPLENSAEDPFEVSDADTMLKYLQE